MTIHIWKDRDGNTCMADRRIEFSKPDDSEDVLAQRKRESDFAAYVNARGSVEINGVLYEKTADGGYSARIAGRPRLSDILLSESNAKPSNGD